MLPLQVGREKTAPASLTAIRERVESRHVEEAPVFDQLFARLCREISGTRAKDHVAKIASFHWSQASPGYYEALGCVRVPSRAWASRRSSVSLLRTGRRGPSDEQRRSAGRSDRGARTAPTGQAAPGLVREHSAPLVDCAMDLGRGAQDTFILQVAEAARERSPWPLPRSRLASRSSIPSLRSCTDRRPTSPDPAHSASEGIRTHSASRGGRQRTSRRTKRRARSRRGRCSTRR
jgi:hypothetical protein